MVVGGAGRTSCPGLSFTLTESPLRHRNPEYARNRAATILVFARQPVAGRVKRRLARGLGGRRAAAIYQRLLQRTVAEIDDVPRVRRIAMVAAGHERPWFSRVLRTRGWESAVQVSGTLGARMADAFIRFADSDRPTILIGSDIADFCAADIRQACRALERSDLVLGPVSDGGYWLIGMRRPYPALFKDIAWSSERVLAQTLEKAESQQLSHYLLVTRHDIDRARDISRLK